MKCSLCEKSGLKSITFEKGCGSTLMSFDPFYDEEGRRHIHDPNTITTFCSCSNGHNWTENSKRACWCGWPDKAAAGGDDE